MGCFDSSVGYGSQEELEKFYLRPEYSREVGMYFAYSPDRSHHYTLLLDRTDNTVGLVCPGADDVEEWYSQAEGDAFFEYRPLEQVLLQVPKGYTLEDTHGKRYSGPSDVLPKL